MGSQGSSRNPGRGLQQLPPRCTHVHCVHMRAFRSPRCENEVGSVLISAPLGASSHQKLGLPAGERGWSSRATLPLYFTQIHRKLSVCSKSLSTGIGPGPSWPCTEQEEEFWAGGFYGLGSALCRRSPAGPSMQEPGAGSIPEDVPTWPLHHCLS